MKRFLKVIAALAVIAVPPIGVFLVGDLVEPDHESPSDAMALYWVVVSLGAAAALVLALACVVVWVLLSESDRSDVAQP